jgi:hypothetical protein
VLVVDDTNAVEVLADGLLGRGPAAVACERAEEDGHQWIAAAHNGYRRRHGVTYARELYLSADGDDMRGEDRLTGRSGVAFAVRFHLHPAVTPALAPDGNSAVLRLPGGAAWRLRAVGAEMSLAESVYLASGEVRPTRQIVLTGTTGRDGATVRWAIKREPALTKAKTTAAEAVATKPAATEPISAAAPETSPGAKDGLPEPKAPARGTANADTAAPGPDEKQKPPEGVDDGA